MLAAIPASLEAVKGDPVLVGAELRHTSPVGAFAGGEQ
jgi:hypothetical protein